MLVIEKVVLGVSGRSISVLPAVYNLADFGATRLT